MHIYIYVCVQVYVTVPTLYRHVCVKVLGLKKNSVFSDRSVNNLKVSTHEIPLCCYTVKGPKKYVNIVRERRKPKKTLKCESETDMRQEGTNECTSWLCSDCGSGGGNQHVAPCTICRCKTPFIFHQTQPQSVSFPRQLTLPVDQLISPFCVTTSTSSYST